ncbi:MAG: NUDIX hydrolase [Thermoprotei archaeon]|nr:NUDIX hydrolase [Thermoprotei archaeon]
MGLCKGRRVLFEYGYEVLPNGVKVLVDRVIFPDSVAALPLTGDGRVFLVRQYRPTIRKWVLEAPAGTLKPGEDPRDAALRELEEEAGLTTDNLEYVGGGYVSPGYSTEYMKLYIAWNPRRGEPRREAHEVIEKVVELSLGKAREMIYAGEIADVKTITLILAASLKLGLKVESPHG